MGVGDWASKPQCFSSKREVSSFKPECSGFKCEIWSFKPECSGFKCEIWSFKPECSGFKCEIWSFKLECSCLKCEIWSFKPECSGFKCEIQSNPLPFCPQHSCLLRVKAVTKIVFYKSNTDAHGCTPIDTDRLLVCPQFQCFSAKLEIPELEIS